MDPDAARHRKRSAMALFLGGLVFLALGLWLGFLEVISLFATSSAYYPPTHDFLFPLVVGIAGTLTGSWLLWGPAATLAGALVILGLGAFALLGGNTGSST